MGIREQYHRFRAAESRLNRLDQGRPESHRSLKTRARCREWIRKNTAKMIELAVRRGLNGHIVAPRSLCPLRLLLPLFSTRSGEGALFKNLCKNGFKSALVLLIVGSPISPKKNAFCHGPSSSNVRHTRQSIL